jgi:hypothetical protein
MKTLFLFLLFIFCESFEQSTTKLLIKNPLFEFYKTHSNPLSEILKVKLIYNKKTNDLYLKSKFNFQKNLILGHFYLENSSFVLDKKNLETKLKNPLDENKIDLFTMMVLNLYFELEIEENTLFKAYLSDIKLRFPSFKTPIFWNKNKLKELQHSYLLTHTEKRKSELMEKYKNIKHHLSLFKTELPEFKFKTFKYLSMILYSRGIFSKDNIKLFPMIDLLNRYQDNGEINVFTGDLKDLKQNKTLLVSKIEMKKDVILKKNEPSSNIHLIVDQGVCHPNNQISLVYFSLKQELMKRFNSISNSYLKGKVKKFLRVKNLFMLDVVQVTNELHPYDMDPRVLLFLRLINLRQHQIQQVERILPSLGESKTGISGENESNMLKSLYEIFEAVLKKYTTTIEEDEKLIKSEKDEIMKCIFILRKEEKEVLKYFLNSIQNIKLNQKK